MARIRSPFPRTRTYSEASQMLNKYIFEWLGEFDERAGFFVTEVRARSLTEARHLFYIDLRKLGYKLTQVVRMFDKGVCRSWVHEGHKKYVPKVFEHRKFDREIYERAKKENPDAF